jgi:cyclic pyranopterin phosphate synthase
VLFLGGFLKSGYISRYDSVILLIMTTPLSHFDESGASRMVDVSGKSETVRTATASAKERMSADLLQRIQNKTVAKGEVLEVARIAGIMGAKKTPELIPLCHPLAISGIEVQFRFPEEGTLEILATVRITGKTGVEMEALTAVSVAALTIFDMCKAVDKGMTIERIRLEEKTGGKSGDFKAAIT